MSVCLCSLFCIVLMMLETLTKLKHLLVSSSFIRPPANPLSLSLSLSPSVCFSLSLVLVLPSHILLVSNGCVLIFSLSLSLSCVRLSLSLSLSLCLFSLSLSLSLSLYPPSNLSVSLHTHLFSFPSCTQTSAQKLFGCGHLVYLSSWIVRLIAYLHLKPIVTSHVKTQTIL